MVTGPAGERERPARGDDVKPALRVENVGETKQVVLVGPAAVVEDKQPGGLGGRRPLAVDERAHEPNAPQVKAMYSGSS